MKLIKLYEEFKKSDNINLIFDEVIDEMENNNLSYYAACTKLNINKDLLKNNLSKEQKRELDEIKANRISNSTADQKYNFIKDWDDYHQKSGEEEKTINYDPGEKDDDYIIDDIDDSLVRKNKIIELNNIKDTISPFYYMYDSVELNYEDGLIDGLNRLINGYIMFNIPKITDYSYNLDYLSYILDLATKYKNPKFVKIIKEYIKKTEKYKAKKK